MNAKEMQDIMSQLEIAPDDIMINNKPWKLECTYSNRAEAMQSAEMLGSYLLFKYIRGYALYERNYDF